jgi:hypothetical protein
MTLLPTAKCRVDDPTYVELPTAKRRVDDPTYCVAVFRGYNDGTFNTTPHYFFVTDHEDENIAPKPCFVQVWDMNNDGLQDIVTSNNTADSISVLLQYPHNEEQ